MLPFYESLQKTWNSGVKEKEMYHLEHNSEHEHQLTLTLSPWEVMQWGTDGCRPRSAFITLELRKHKPFIWGINKSALCSGGRLSTCQGCLLCKYPWEDSSRHGKSFLLLTRCETPIEYCLPIWPLYDLPIYLTIWDSHTTLARDICGFDLKSLPKRKTVYV